MTKKELRDLFQNSLGIMQNELTTESLREYETRNGKEAVDNVCRIIAQYILNESIDPYEIQLKEGSGR